VIDWLWDVFILQRIQRIANGVWKYEDVTFILTVLGGFILAFVWFLRSAGDKEAAEQWEKGIRETAALAKREGWHGVLHWHSRFGLGKRKEAQPQINPKSDWLFFAGAIALVAVLGLIALTTR